MPEPVCCDVHEAIYLSLFCASILYFSFITVALSTFFQSFSWVDLVSCIILFLLLCLSGGRLLLLNAGLSKDVYYEARSYEDILIAEKPDLLSTFPFVRKIEDIPLYSPTFDKVRQRACNRRRAEYSNRDMELSHHFC